MIPPRRILLADDDLEVRHGVADLLSPLGLEILHAESGPETVEIVQLEKPRLDLMLLDMHMPGFGGLEVLSQLTQLEDFELPCICCSGEATDELERLALAAGALSFLRKPLQPQALRGEVMRALEIET
jgi:CheY-like chemotaxis protein